MEYIRQHSKKFMFILLILIVPSFVLWGVDGYTRNQQKSKVVAKVGNQEISNELLDLFINEQAARFSGQLNQETLNSDSFKYATLQQMINDNTIRYLASKYRYNISDKQLYDIIANDSELSTDKKVDIDKLKQMAAEYNMSLANLENNIRQNIALDNFKDSLTKSNIVSEKRIALLDNLFNERYVIERSIFNATDFLDSVTLSDTELKDYYQQNKQQFLTTEKADVSYLAISENNLTKNIQVDENELKSYYQQNYTAKSMQRKFSNILIKVVDSNFDEAKTKAQEILQKALAKEDFANLAKQYSQDSLSAEDGGDYGWINYTDLPENLANAIYSTEPNTVYDQVIQTEYGFHIIKITEAQNPPSFAQEKEKLAENYKKERARTEFVKVLESFKNLTFDNPTSLAPAAEQLNLTIQRANNISFNTQENTETIFKNKDLISAIFDPKTIAQNYNTQPIEVDNQFIVVHVDNHYPKVIPPIENIKPQLTEAVKKQKAIALAKDETQKLLETAKQKNIKLKQDLEITVQQPAGLSINEIYAIFRNSSNQLPSYFVVNEDEKFTLFKLKAIKPIATNNTSEATKAFLEHLQANAENQAYLKELRKLANVKILIPEPTN